MIKNFSKKFGNSKETVFILGDWDKENNHMKGSEPTINKRFRRIYFSMKNKAGYETYLINEFRTIFKRKYYAMDVIVNWKNF